MILTEDKNYTMSLEVEDRESATGLIGKNIEMEFSARELLHAVITCGIPVQRMTTAYFSKKKLELIYKLFLVETALDTEGDRLKKARRIAYLDSSEKSVMSYYMGMFLTKLISRRLYGVDYLTHLNLIQSMDGNGFVDFFNSEWRQDMIGFQPDKKSWSVWEAKGGSNRREQALKKGCQQAAAIESVNGLAPDPGAVCMTYYDHSFLCGVIRQPENSQAKNRERVCFTEEAFFRAYYKPICEMFMEQGTRLHFHGKNAEISLSVPCFPEKEQEEEERRIHVGMSQKLLLCLMENDYSRLAAEREALTKCVCPEGAFWGGDGIYIR
nr:hypothetical protein [uncultured Blautia sp.]